MVHTSAMLFNCSSSSSCMTTIQAADLPGVVAALPRPCPAGNSASSRISLKNVGRSMFRLRREAQVARLTKSSGGSGGRGLGKQGGVGLVVRASTMIGVVKEVRTEVEGLYYNLTLTVPQTSELEEWYWQSRPGRYLNLLPAKTTQNKSASVYVASPVSPLKVMRPPEVGQVSLEFLIQEAGTDSVADELINSQAGDSVVITTATSTGFTPQTIEAAESVLMFASGYGIGPIRAVIETGFGANRKKDAILYTLYAPNQEPYMAKHPMWEKSGVKVVPFECSIKPTDPARTVVIMVASVDEQEDLINYFEAKGVPSNNILTLFDGIPTSDKLYINMVHSKHNFLPMGDRHVPFPLKL